MPPPQIFSLDGHAFGLTVSGVQLIDFIPTDVAPIRWEMPSESTTGGISFTVEDTGATSLPAGSVVRLTDNVNNELLASGVLVNRRYRRGTGPYRYVDCEVAGWGWYLDHRIVTEYVWPRGQGLIDDQVYIAELIHQFGGPLTPMALVEYPADPFLAVAGTASRTTLRSAFGSIESKFDILGPRAHVYVNNDAEVRWWWGNYDTALGTATYSIGDQGDFVPENATYEVGSEDRANIVAAYSTADAFIQWAWVGAAGGGVGGDASPVSPWDAGQPTTYWQDSVGYADPERAAQYETWASNADIASVTFTTVEYGGWKPHQALVVDDSLLTGGTAETHYIAAVSGSIDYRNLVEYRVTTGAVARSIVQTVATP